MLLKKSENLRKTCGYNCKCFTGPHSVLQIFIEQIVRAVEQFGEKLKKLIQDDYDLYLEAYQNYSFSELKYTINNIDINVILHLLAQEQELEQGLKQGLKDGLAETG